jgi:hypothetical protein
MEWIVKIEGEYEKTQRIRITFDPLGEKITFYGEVKLKNKWTVFSWFIYDGIEIQLEDIQKKMEDCVVAMRRRFDGYMNLAEGFTVLKWVAFEDDESIDDESTDEDLVPV